MDRVQESLIDAVISPCMPRSNRCIHQAEARMSCEACSILLIVLMVKDYYIHPLGIIISYP